MFVLGKLFQTILANTVALNENSLITDEKIVMELVSGTSFQL